MAKQETDIPTLLVSVCTTEDSDGREYFVARRADYRFMQRSEFEDWANQILQRYVPEGSTFNSPEPHSIEEPVRLSDEPGYVYLVGNANFGLYKIGCTSQPKFRVAQLQKQAPFLFTADVRVPVNNKRAVESKLHNEFNQHNVKGEWFQLSYEDYIKATELLSNYDSDRVY